VRRRGSRLGVAAAIAAVATACGCGNGGSAPPTSAAPPPPATVTTGAPPEGEVVVAAPPGTFSRALLARLNARTGCSAQVRPLAPAGAAAALDGGADVALVRSDDAGALAASGATAPLDLGQLGNLSMLAGPFRHPAATTIDGAAYGVPVLWAPLALLASSRAYPDGAPPGFRVLYQPASRGRIAVLDDPLVIAAAASFLGVARPFAMSDDDLRSALDLLHVQRGLGVRYVRTPAGLSRLFSRGRLLAALGPAGVAGARSGAIESTIPRTGTVGWMQELVVAPHPRHPTCAYRLIAWATTPAIQARLAAATGEGPANPRACDLSPPACALIRTNDGSTLRRITWAQAPTSATSGALDGATWDEDWRALVSGG
jgi:putative spermidine/putrescine transport system substrate-binding protein